MSAALRKLTALISKARTCCIFTNQIREKIGVMFGNPETTPGGKALKFYSSVRVDIRRIGAIKQTDGTVTGNRTKIKIVKNKVAPPFTEAEFDIMYNEGISSTGSLLDLALEKGIVEKRGSWLSYKGTQLAQGRDAAKEVLKNDEALYDETRGRREGEARRGEEVGVGSWWPSARPDRWFALSLAGRTKADSASLDENRSGPFRVLSGSLLALAAEPSSRTSSSSSPTITPTRPSAPTAIRGSCIETPNIDRIAKEGMRFDRCLCTNSICGPSRATVLTGKYSHLNGFYNNSNSRFDGSQMTFPKLLQAAGYQTAIIGKWHLDQRSDRLRFLGNPAGPGRLLQPADDPQRRAASSTKATSPTSSPTRRSTGSSSATSRSRSC